MIATDDATVNLIITVLSIVSALLATWLPKLHVDKNDLKERIRGAGIATTNAVQIAADIEDNKPADPLKVKQLIESLNKITCTLGKV